MIWESSTCYVEKNPSFVLLGSQVLRQSIAGSWDELNMDRPEERFIISFIYEDIYCDNHFRVLSLSTDATTREVKRHAEKIRQKQESGEFHNRKMNGGGIL